MNIDVYRINAAHELFNNYRSPIADTFNGNGILENYIKAKLTNRKTVRLLLDQDQLQDEQNAIAEEISKKVVAIFS